MLQHLQRHDEVLLLLLHLGEHEGHLAQSLLLLHDLRPGDLDVLALEWMTVLQPHLQQPGGVLPELAAGELGRTHVVEGVDEDGGEVPGVALEPREEHVDLSGPALLVVVRAVPHLDPPGVVAPLGGADDAVAPELTAEHSP